MPPDTGSSRSAASWAAAELERARSLLAAHRLLTLTGSGGCGKTRLAIELAQRQDTQFPQGHGSSTWRRSTAGNSS